MRVESHACRLASLQELKRQIVALDGQGLGDLIASLRQQLSEKERDIIELRLLVR